MVGRREPVDVGERPHAQRAQHRLGRRHETQIGEPAQDRDDQNDDGTDPADAEDDISLEALVGQEALVDHLLHEHRDGESTDRREHREEDGEPQASAQLGALTQPATQHGHRSGTQDAVTARGIGDTVRLDVPGRVVEGLGVLEGQHLVVPVAVVPVVPVGRSDGHAVSSSA